MCLRAYCECVHVALWLKPTAVATTNLFKMPDHDTKPFLPTLSVKGQHLYNLPVRAKSEHPNVAPAVLCSGSVFSTKTWSIIVLILRHLWETPGARFIIFAKAVKTLNDAGPWKLLQDYILPEWTNPETGIGMRITSKNREGVYGPITDSKTRTILIRVTNYWGGESELQLNSINHDSEVDEKLLSTFFSGVWFSELKLWNDPAIFRVSRSRLRMPQLAPWQHLWIADTNPPKEGTKSWIWPIWFDKHRPPPEHLKAIVGDINEEVVRSRHLLEWTMDDNIFASEAEKQARKMELADDPLIFQRDALGLWVAGGGGTSNLFSSVFSVTKHVLGVVNKENPQRGQIRLDASTDHLHGGWDLGGGANHAAGCIEKRIVITPAGPVSVFSVIFSLARIGEHVLVQDFTKDYMELKQTLLSRYPNRNFEWTHFSDDSAVNQPRSSGAGFDYLEVMIASDNDIVLTGVPKPKNSVSVRIRLLRRLIREGRFYVSADCADVIAMLLEASSNPKEEIEWNEHKHVFDWISYVLYMLCFDELEEMSRKPEAHSEPTSIRVPL